MRYLKAVLPFLVLASVITLTFPPEVAAQGSTTGEIRGLVRDPSGALVPGATVKAHDIATGWQKSSTSAADGAFVLLSLQAGSYQVTVSAQGFQTSITEGVVVTTGRTTDMQVELKVGNVTETVQVSGEAAKLETSSNQVSTTVSTSLIQELPFPSRDSINFALLMPGSQTTSDTSGRFSTFNGLPNASMNISIDGVNNNSQRFKTGGTSFFEFAPSRLDALDEVMVSTTGAGSDAGGEGAMQVRFTTKRGTETYHFKVFEQFQNEDLNANTFFRNLQGQPLAKTRANNFGGSFGGKLLPFIPYFRHRLFFFVNIEGFPQPGSTTLAANVLTPASQAGNFTYVGTDGQTRTVNLLQAAGAAGFSSAMDPTVTKILGQMNGSQSKASGFVPITGKPFAQTMTWTQSTRNAIIYPTARLDYQVSDKVNWHGTWNLRHQNITGSNPNYPGAGAYNNGYKITTYVATSSVDYTITPSLLNNFTFGVQSNGEYFSQGATPHQWSDYGDRVIVLPGFTMPSSVSGAPTTLNPYVNTALPFIRNNPVYNLTDNLSWVKGRHKITFGGTALHTSFYETSWGTFGGVPSYTLGTATGDPVTAALQSALPNVSTTNGDLTNAQALYALLTGRLASSSITRNVDEKTHQYAEFSPVTQRFAFSTAGLYVQDSFRWKPSFTVNIGLRMELDGSIHNTNGIDTQPTPDSFFGPSTGLFQPGTLNGNSNPIFQITKNPYGADLVNFSPNLGFAWNPAGSNSGWTGKLLGDHKTVFRASYSITHYNEGMNAISNILSGNPGTTQSGSLLPGSPGFALGGLNLTSPNIPAIALSPASFSTTLPEANYTFARGSNYINPNLVSPYVQNWNFSVQREIARGTVLEVRYLGNKATHVWHNYDQQETNIFENGFLGQFVQAQKNLSANVAAGKGNTFINNGLPGQGPLPIFDAAFGQRGSIGAVATGSGYGNSTFITNLQQGTAGTLATSLASSSTYLCRMVGNTFAPCAALGYNAAGPYPANFFRANPFVNTLNYQDDDANTNYNALQLELRKALTHGLVLTANYTWSHTLGTLYNITSQNALFQNHTLRNKGLDYGPTPFDIRQSFQTYFTYELPFGKGHRFAINNGLAERIIGGWSIGGLYRYTSGLVSQLSGTRSTVNGFTTATGGAPGGVVLGSGLTLNQLQYDLTHISGYNASGKNLITQTGIIGSNGQANPAFLAPASTPGVFGSLLYLYGPNVLQMDMSVTKEIPIRERLKFAFQAEALNFLNHPVFPIANTNPTSSGFGQVSSTFNNPRNIQLRAYISF